MSVEVADEMAARLAVLVVTAFAVLTTSPPAAAAPSNDHVAAATPIDAFPYGSVIDTSGSTVEPGEPNSPCAETAAATVWYVATVTEETIIELKTEDSDFDTVLAVYVRDSFADMTWVVCSDGSQFGASRAAVRFQAHPGQRYWVQVGGIEGVTGILRLSARASIDAPVTTHVARYSNANGGVMLADCTGIVHPFGGQDGGVCFSVDEPFYIDLAIDDDVFDPPGAYVMFGDGAGSWSWFDHRFCGSARDLYVPMGTRVIQVFVGPLSDIFLGSCPTPHPASNGAVTLTAR